MIANAERSRRRSIARLALRLSVVLVLVAVARAPSSAVRAGSMSGPPGPRDGGALVIAGGGRLPEAVYGRFLELAGGRDARIVLIPTARLPTLDGVAPAEDLRPWVARGVASARLLHTRSRATADDPAFSGSLAEATGVWIGGGSQSRLFEVYGGTEVERRLEALLARGGVIGGSSAGAAVMTRVMIAGGQAVAIEGRGFDFLPGAVVDQHFLKRKRLGRLAGLLERHPDLIGFGIDEGTALVVEVRDRRFGVVGDSSVVACLPASDGQPARTEVLKDGDRTDLAALARKPGGPVGPSALSLSPPDGPGRSR